MNGALVHAFVVPCFLTLVAGGRTPCQGPFLQVYLHITGKE